MSSPKVFISATSADLAPAREVVKKALLDIGCHPIEQTNFPPDWRTVKQMLREKIEDCQGLIHIVGLHYGAEPDPEELPTDTPRRSYAQLEYDIACELQRERGAHFQVYRFICPDGFPYQPVADMQSEEQRALQDTHRERLLAGAAQYEQPSDLEILEKRILSLRQHLVRLDAEAIAAQLKREVHTRFEQAEQAADEAGAKWVEIRELERRRDAALANVDAVVRTIADGLAGNPVPIFTKATRILQDEGADAALGYLKSHKKDQLDRVDQVSAQAEAAQEALQRELQPLMLQADLHETTLEWEQALTTRELVAEKAPSWFVARDRLGALLRDLANYDTAEPHLRAAQTLAGTPDEEAAAFNNLALLLANTNRLAEAESLYRRALSIHEAILGPDHPNVATELNNLALLLQDTNRLVEAESLHRRALAIHEARDHPNVATDLNSLALLLQATNRLAEAELLYRRALAIDEASLGPDHPNVGADVNNLAMLLQATNRLAEAEPLMRRALAINEASLGPDHPDVAATVNNLALLLQDDDRLGEAEPLYRRALTILEASLDPDHPDVAATVNNLALLLKTTERLAEAEPLYRRALTILEASLGQGHPKIATAVHNLASLLEATDRLTEAEPQRRRMLEILLLSSRRTGHKHPDVKLAAERYISLLSAMGKDETEQQKALDAIKKSVIAQVSDPGDLVPPLSS